MERRQGGADKADAGKNDEKWPNRHGESCGWALPISG
jgi:hypothetical protein